MAEENVITEAKALLSEYSQQLETGHQNANNLILQFNELVELIQLQDIDEVIKFAAGDYTKLYRVLELLKTEIENMTTPYEPIYETVQFIN